mgnify:FL=1
MTRIILIALLSVVSMVSAKAKNVGDMLVSMPDSLLPYVATEQLVDLVNMKRIDPATPASLQSVFKTDIVLETLSDDMLKLQMSNVCYEIGRLPMENDSVFCVLRTIPTPEQETNVIYVNKEWEKIGEQTFGDINLVSKPDTMDSKEYDRLLSLVEYPIIEAHFCKSPSEIMIKQHVQMLDKADKEKFLPLLMQRKLKWDGESYK